MTTLSKRFGAGDPSGEHAAEWVAMWKSDKSDVYIAARSLDGNMKASIHESGQCHVRAPDPSKWRSPGRPPQYLEKWAIDPRSALEFPIGIIVPRSELSRGPWQKHKDKGTLWIPMRSGAVQVGVMLVNADPVLTDLSTAGWHTLIVCERLPDGRHLLIAAGDAEVSSEKRVELESVKRQARALRAADSQPLANARLIFFAGSGQGTRNYVEAGL
jgi:hypothetical protein